MRRSGKQVVLIDVGIVAQGKLIRQHLKVDNSLH